MYLEIFGNLVMKGLQVIKVCIAKKLMKIERNISTRQSMLETQSKQYNDLNQQNDYWKKKIL